MPRIAFEGAEQFARQFAPVGVSVPPRVAATVRTSAPQFDPRETSGTPVRQELISTGRDSTAFQVSRVITRSGGQDIRKHAVGSVPDPPIKRKGRPRQDLGVVGPTLSGGIPGPPTAFPNILSSVPKFEQIGKPSAPKRLPAAKKKRDIGGVEGLNRVLSNISAGVAAARQPVPTTHTPVKSDRRGVPRPDRDHRASIEERSASGRPEGERRTGEPAESFFHEAKEFAASKSGLVIVGSVLVLLVLTSFFRFRR